MSAAVAFAAIEVYGDIPPPQVENPTTDWSFVLMGAVSAFLGAMLCLWIGRKLFKRR